jgi:hypothetical protein
MYGVFPTVGWHTYGYTTLRDRFEIIGCKECIEKVLGEFRFVLGWKKYSLYID